MSADTSDHTGDNFSNYLTHPLEECTVYWLASSTDVDLKIKKVFIETKWSTNTFSQFWGLDEKKSVLTCLYKPFCLHNEVHLDESYRLMSETNAYQTYPNSSSPSADSILQKVMRGYLPKLIIVENHQEKCGFMSTAKEYGIVSILLIPVFDMKKGCIGVMELAVRNTQDIFRSFNEFVVSLKKETDLFIFNQTEFGQELAQEYGTPGDVSQAAKLTVESQPLAINVEVDEDNIPAALTNEYLTQQLNKGKRPVEIADIIGCTPATVRNNINSFGITYTKYKRATYKTKSDTSVKKNDQPK